MEEEYKKPKCLLIIDDDSLDVEFLRRWWDYERFNIAISVVENGAEAMRYLRRENGYKEALRPNMILLDLNMPEKDGREVLAEIKSDERFTSIPVVILTSSESNADVQKCVRGGACSYLVKPIGWRAYSKIVHALEDLWLANAKFDDLITEEGPNRAGNENFAR